jgi:phosphohistidine phosphatase
VKQLLLLRHAEAEPAAPGTRDIDRVLTERGRQEALEAAEVIAAAGLSIDEILLSPARRTSQSADIMMRRLGLLLAVERVPALYLGAAQALLQALQGCRSTSNTVLVIGHNPGISELAQQLSRSTPGLTLRTGGVCQLTFAQQHWDGIGSDAATTWAVLR